MDILRVYQQALGATPAAITMLPIELGALEVESIVATRDTESGQPSRPVGAKEAWPLVSHHQFNEYTLFGQDREVVDERTLSYLLSFNGVVAADPLAVVSDLCKSGELAGATAALRAVTRQLAQVEPLVEGERLRFTDARPSFSESTRAQVLGAFGIDPSFRVFTNFIEAYETIRDSPHSGNSSFTAQAERLFEMMGFDRPTLVTSTDAVSAVRRLGQSLIHLSWQLSVATTDPNVDISPLNGLEQHLFRSLIMEALPSAVSKEGSARRTRHFSLIGSAGIPNLDRAGLTVQDVLAIRHDDTFEQFRSSLQRALDAYIDGDSDDEGSRREAFEDVMKEASFRLRERSKSASFAARVGTASAQTAVQVAAAFLPSEWIAAKVSAEVATSPLMALVLDWLSARRAPSPYEIAHRYCIRLSRMDDLRV